MNTARRHIPIALASCDATSIIDLVAGRRLAVPPEESLLRAYKDAREIAFALARSRGGAVELVRIPGLDLLDVIIWGEQRLVVREVTNMGTHKDALFIRVFGREPLHVGWDAEIVRVVL